MKYTKTKKYHVVPDENDSKKQKLFRVVLVLCTLVMLICSGFSGYNYWKNSQKVITTAPDPKETVDELTDPKLFIQKYLAVNCSEEVIKNTRTMRVTGKVLFENGEQEFSLTKKLPDLMRLRITQKQLEITISANGDTVWRRIRLPQKEDKVELIEGEAAKPWLSESRFYDHIINTSLGDGQIESISKDEYDATTYLNVSITTGDGDPVEILVDPRTLYPFAEIEQTSIGETITIMSDFRHIDGMPLPFRIETFGNGELIRTILIETAASNTGILSDLFDMPSELSAPKQSI